MEIISKIQKFSAQGYFYILLIYCFIIPVFPKMATPLTIVFFLFWVLEGKFRQRFQSLKTEKYRFCFLLPILFFLWHCIRFLFSTNDANYELFDIQTKIFLFVLPFLFLLLPASLFTKKYLKHYFAAFILGFLTYAFYTLLRGSYFYFFRGLPFQICFLYSYLSDYLHPSYAALFGAFALLFCFYLRKYKEKALPKWIIDILTWFIAVYICLLSSKAGIIGLVIILILSLFYRIRKREGYWQQIFLMLFLLILSIVAIQKTDIVKARYSEITEAAVSKNSNNANNSTSIRVVLWKSALNGFLHENIWIGEGPGKVKSTLAEEAKKIDASAIAEGNYNAHNQFLQTLLALGIIGFVILLSCFLIPFYVGIKHKMYFLILFIGLMTINNLVESMLEVFKGNLFFGFFFCFFFLQGFAKEAKQ